MKQLCSALLLSAAFAAPVTAFGAAKTIDTLQRTVSIPVESITCKVTGANLNSYVASIEGYGSVSIKLDEGKLSDLPIMKHSLASLELDSPSCPSKEELVGKTTNGETEVKITRTLKTVTVLSYSDCDSRRLDETIEITLQSGKVLRSHEFRALSGSCDSL